jgi:ABC-2 type transport system permease protein
VNGPLLRRTLAANAVRLLVISIGLGLMGVVMPVMFVAFGQEVGAFVESVPLLERFADFGGGNVFSLSGSMALAFSHPFTLLLLGIMAVAYPALAIAGERDRGTLEVTLSRPISRRGLFGTLYVAGLFFIGLLVAVLAVSSTAAAVAVGLGHELALGNMLALYLGAGLLFVAFMSLTFAVSAESDRAAPAIGIPAVFILINYLAWAIGSIWPDARWLGDYSIFNLLKAQETIADGLRTADALLLLGFSAVCVAVALYRFPRRDLPAPS